MNSLMAAWRGSNVESWKARADSEDVVLDAHEGMQLLEIGQIVDPSLSLRKRWGKVQERSDEGEG